ncbi:MAG: ATP synthase F1 subunit delta [Fimbriimonadia bacterium]|jgi:F-type H+-transporting ATPase subunit delta
MSRRVAKRYARALFHAARDKGMLAAVADDLGVLANLFATDEAFRNLLLSPVGDVVSKGASMEKLSGRVSDLTRDLLSLLIHKRREDALPEIQEEFELLRKEFEGVADAEVITATELSEDEQRRVIGYLERKTGMRIQATFSVDPEIIGGVKVVLRDTLMDGSIRGNLDGLRERLYRDVLIQA